MKTLLIYTFLFASIFAQPDYEGNKQFSADFTDNIYFDVVNYHSEKEGLTLARFFVEVPYKNLSFIKKADKYESVYNIDVTIFNKENDKVIAEKIWAKKLTVDNYRITASGKGFDISYKDIEVKPDEYKIKIVMEDTYSLNRIQFGANLKINQVDSAFGISDVILVDKIISRNGKDILIPNIRNFVDSGSDSLQVFYKIYSDTKRDVLINYEVYAKVADESFLVTDHVTLNTGENNILKKLSNLKFMLGKYSLTIKVNNEQSSKEIKSQKPFNSRLKYYPSSITDIEVASNQMVYIAPSEVIDEIFDAKSFEEKINKFKAYWDSKDPSPGSPYNEVLLEYYRRVEYANKHFKHYFPGWKTDMGKVYITLGQPNQVDRHPLELDSKPYEVWNYYGLNLQFVFVDETGFGDFRLTSPLSSEWYRYRQ